MKKYVVLSFVLSVLFVAAYALTGDAATGSMFAMAGAVLTQNTIETKLTFTALPGMGQDGKFRVRISEGQYYGGVALKTRNGFIPCDTHAIALDVAAKLNDPNSGWTAAIIGNRPGAGGVYEAQVFVAGVSTAPAQAPNSQE